MGTSQKPCQHHARSVTIIYKKVHVVDMYTCIDLYEHDEMHLSTSRWPLVMHVTSAIHKFSLEIIIILLACIMWVLFNETAKFTPSFFNFEKLYININNNVS